MTSLKRINLTALLAVLIAGRLPASVLLNVPATSNIFSAGQAGQTAQELDFLPAAGNVLTFTGPGIPLGSAVTGTVFCSPLYPGAGPDGANLGSQQPATNIYSSTSNLSPIQFTGTEMFLVAVFLGPGLPSSPVASIGNYGAGGALSSSNPVYTPLVGQVFFVGDGLTGTGSGAIQQFIVPTGATRLFLGFADALDFNGQAGSYSDNSGSLNVNLQILTPEPGTLTFFILGLAGLAIGRKKPFA